MAGISKVILIGHLGRDPETRYTPSGVMNVQFSIAVSRRFNDSSGQPQESTNWFRVTGWGRLAETMDRLSQSGALVKGKQVYVEGRLDAREYTDNNNQQRTSLDVNASEMQLLGTRGDSEGGFGGPSSSGGGTGDPGGPGKGRGQQDQEFGDMDDVPF